LWLGNARPNWKVAAGLLVGFVGVYLLIAGKGGGINAGRQWIGYGAVIFGALSWAVGSIYGLKASTPRSSLLTSGMQMLAGSVSLFLVGLIRGEHASFDVSAVSSNSVFALFYLIIFGSLMGFTAYSWLLKIAQPAMVATYAYVNPVIAVILGWSIAGESLTAQMLIGAFVIVASVILITANKSEKPDDDDVTIHHSQTPAGNRPSYSTSS
jgi:drug/metabolite transporter (DMT)-like permease